MKFWIISFIVIAIVFAGIYFAFTTSGARGPDALKKTSLELFDLINQERIKNGEIPLIWDDNIAKAAQEHSQWMAETNQYKHSNNGYSECIMVGIDPKEVFEAWLNSSPHNAIMMGSDAKYGAVGMGLKLSQVKIGNIHITYATSCGYSTFETSY